LFSTITTLALTLFVAAAGTSQSISEGELARMATTGSYPIGCQEAALASRGLRAKPTTDPATLHGAVKAYRACAIGPYGAGSSALRNQANFNASAALLLAARHELNVTATSDAQAAGALAQAIVAYRRPDNPRTPGLNDDPSIYRTDAGRIARDAAALPATLAEGTHA
jgi:hypothetical protein